MVLPKPGTMFALDIVSRTLTRDAIGHVLEHHAWLFKFKLYDIIPDVVHLASIATGSTVYVSSHTFNNCFKEIADVSAAERAT